MKNLTEGSPSKVIISFAIPLMLGNVLQQLYNMTDTKIVSSYVDTDAMAAVGATAILSNTLIGFISGLTQGFAILIARSFGADKKDEVRKNIAGTAVLTAVSGISITVFGLIYIEKMLVMLDTPQELMNYATEYVRIIILGIVFCSIYNCAANILRAVGDSVVPLICLMISVFLNIGLDFLFILGFDMSIRGAAAATVISQGIAALSCLICMLKRIKEVLPHKSDWRISPHMYGQLIMSGLAMGFMGCIVNIGSIIIQKSINDLGTVYVKAHTAARRVFDLMMIMIYTIGFAMTTYASQNLGAGKYERIRKGIKSALIIDTLINTVLLAVCLVFGRSLVAWVASNNSESILNPGYRYLIFGSLFAYVLGPLFIFRCSLQGLGHKMMPLFTSFLEMAIKIVFAAALIPRYGYNGVIFTEPVSWVFMTAFLLAAVLKVLHDWKKEKKI